MDDDEVHHIHLGGATEETPREYAKLVGVLVGIFLVSFGLSWLRGLELTRFLSDFMAIFLITFAAFKFVNLEEFVAAYQGYDIVAKRFRTWAFIFPFVEAGLGLFYLLLTDSAGLNLITMLVTGVGTIGVWREVRNKSNIMCACLGTIIRLPLSKVSLIEDVAMFVMAGLMLVAL